MSDGIKGFLERLRTGRLPAYGALYWDGKSGEVVTSVNFELDRSESPKAVCERAHRFFSQLSEGEWRALNIEVVMRNGKPVRATLKSAAPGIVTTDRLRQLEKVLW